MQYNKYTTSIKAHINTPFNYTHQFYRVPRTQHVRVTETPTNMSELQNLRTGVCVILLQVSVALNLICAMHRIPFIF